MNTYKVKLVFRYSDTVTVMALNKEDAIKEALFICDEQYECLDDAQVTEKDVTNG